MEARQRLKDRIKGGIIGVAYGDSFGMPVETWSKEKIRSVCGRITSHLPGNEENRISRGLQAFEVTDDTINTIMVIDMLSENRGQVAALDFIKRLRAWAEMSEKSKTVIGPSTAKAFSLLDKGIPMEETGLTGTTNGAAMKILPIGMMHGMGEAFPENLSPCPCRWESLLEDVRKLCLPTHNTSIAISGAAAVAAAACYLTGGGRAFDQMIACSVQAADLGKRYGNQIGAPSVSLRLEYGSRYIREHGKEKSVEFISDFIGTGLPVEQSAVAAVLFACLAKGDPAVCAQDVTNAGGDTDTVAAMACGLCGIYMGSGAFDPRITARLESVNGISFENLSEKMMEAKNIQAPHG